MHRDREGVGRLRGVRSVGADLEVHGSPVVFLEPLEKLVESRFGHVASVRRR
jgi:hypothetical protein